MNPCFRGLVAALSVFHFSAGLTTGATIIFADDFETPSLDPFWFGIANQGTITFPSIAQAHSGFQSVQFDSPPNTFNAVGMQHTFATPLFGQVSVWVYDTGAGLPQSHALDLSIGNNGLTVASLFTLKFDMGPGAGGNYNYSLGSAGIHDTPIDRSQAWHQFSIASTPDSLTMAVDGITVYSGTGSQPFDSILFRMNGGPLSTPWVSYWDDFAFSEMEVPEPSTVVFVLLGSVGIVVRRTRSRRDQMPRGHAPRKQAMAL